MRSRWRVCVCVCVCTTYLPAAVHCNTFCQSMQSKQTANGRQQKLPRICPAINCPPNCPSVCLSVPANSLDLHCALAFQLVSIIRDLLRSFSYCCAEKWQQSSRFQFNLTLRNMQNVFRLKLNLPTLNIFNDYVLFIHLVHINRKTF